MKRSKFSEKQIVYAIRQAESGTPVDDLCWQLGVSELRRLRQAGRRKQLDETTVG